MLACSWVKEDGPSPRKVRAEVAKLFNDDEFQNSIQRATGDRSRTLRRVRDTVDALERAGAVVEVPFDLEIAMPSTALVSLKGALEEIYLLGSTVDLSSMKPESSRSLARVTGRAQIVLLSSHFERYIYAANEEAVSALNSASLASASIPERIRLLHSADLVDSIAKTGWDRRTAQLTKFITDEAWLWSTGGEGTLKHERLLTWMKAPVPKNLVRYYNYWGIEDIFSSATRTPHTRAVLWLGVQELVDVRNNIAHGDYTAQATQQDVGRYMETVATFCARADRLLARAVKSIRGSLPW